MPEHSLLYTRGADVCFVIAGATEEIIRKVEDTLSSGLEHAFVPLQTVEYWGEEDFNTTDYAEVPYALQNAKFRADEIGVVLPVGPVKQVALAWAYQKMLDLQHL